MKTLRPKGSGDRLDEGCRFAALSSEARRCGNRLHAPADGGCFNTEETKDVKRGRRRQSEEWRGNAALPRSTLLLNDSESVSPVQAVNICARPKRPTGQLVLNHWVLLLQLLHSLCVSSSSSSRPPADSSVSALLHGPPVPPSPGPSSSLDSNSRPAEVAFLCDPGALQARLREGPAEELTEDVCISSSERLNQSLVFVHPDVQLRGRSSTSCLLILRLTPEAEHNAEGGRNHGNLTNKHRRGGILSRLDGHRLLRPSSCHLPQDGLGPWCQPLTCQSREDDAVRICATKQAFPTDTDVTFVAVADVARPVDFFWDFGDSTSHRTSSRTITRGYQNPGSYGVFVVASWARTVVTSDVFPVLVQRAVELSRLVHQASVLKDQAVTVSCRVNAGTNLTFRWSFGDGPSRCGQRTTQHVFSRTGEFTINVTVSNVVSSASLSSLLFVVDRPCRPPPVKNMGPLRLQVWRSEVIRLGVTLEADVECDASGGLRYSWTLSDSAGRVVPLSLRDKHRQTLELPSRVLQYDSYTATARVQIFGSVVYSNYTVRLQVTPSPPVALIQGGTNVFINKNTKMITLDGRTSHDPDFPLNPLSYSWTCEPVSTITSSCFDRDVPTSSPELKFPFSLLKDNFDQFRFRLTVHSGERSSSAEVFLTVTSDLTGKVSVSCDECRGDAVNWDQPFSVAATCDDCKEPVQFTWSLHLVNSSSMTPPDFPFCSAADPGAPSAIVEAPGTPTLGSDHSVQTSEPPRFLEKLSVSKSEGLHDLDLSNSEPNRSSRLHPDPTDLRSQISGFTFDPDSSADWEESFPSLESSDVGFQTSDAAAGPDDYDAPFPAEEGDPGMAAGRPSDVGTFSPGDSASDQVLNQNKGHNLVDPKPSVLIQKQTLLDLHRAPIDGAVFESYTYTGLSSSSLRFKPFSLRPKTRYMLEATAKSGHLVLGRTQLFIQTNPVPEGVMCQVQPAEGTALHTHFSIFCTSGHQDLLYKYSYSVRGSAPRILYQGRDFQYYFSLPSGDPSDDYKVTIYTEIRSGRSGSATRPCPVTIRVKPSFLTDDSSSSPHYSDLKLLESALGTLWTLVQLRNSAEVRNHVSALCSVLNRLSQAAEADAQRRVRNALICIVCELESSDQASAEDNVCILNDLLHVTNQVSLMSVRRVTSHVRAVSEQFSEFTAADHNHRKLNSLMKLLSSSLLVVSSCGCTPETLNGVVAQELESESATDHDMKHPESTAGCLTHSEHPVKQRLQLTRDILQTASDLMLRHILFQETKEHRVSTGLVQLHAASLNQTSTTIRSNSTTIHFPASLIQTVLVRLRSPREPEPCVLRVLTELNRSPYCWSSSPVQLTGPVVDFSLYKCSTRRRVHVGSFPKPISFELHHPQTNMSSGSEYVLLRSRINYHNVSISQELLHHAVQVTVVFTLPPGKTFPIMLLFRMFERPTPSMHHLQRIHRWERNTVRITLPPSYINAAGICHLALLDPNFGRVSERRRRSEQIRYSLSVHSSVCLSWDEQQEAWTHHGCRTQHLDTAVNCSCYQLRPLTVLQQQIESSHDTADLDQFLSASCDLTVFGLLMLVLILFVPVLRWCQRADVVSEENHRAHYLSDNNPEDLYFYAVCIHTGLCSAACMTAKVYIVLCGEHGVSQTKELQVPGCTVFRRNSQDTFVLSAAESLGPVWGVHIWHDNSGPSPDWYIKQVMVSEVSSGHVGRSWLFVSESWLSVNRNDGRVERTLRVRGLDFARTLLLRSSDYLADSHMWISVFSCRWPNSFTHTQRLGVCVLLLLGYAAVNAFIVAQTDDLLVSGVVGVSAVSVTSGLLSVVVVLPAATLVSFLFRLCGTKPTGSGVQHASFRTTAKKDPEVRDMDLDAHLSQNSSRMWTQDAWRLKHQDTNVLSVSTTPENKDANEESTMQGRLGFGSSVGPSSVGPPLRGSSLTSEGSYCEGREDRLFTDSDRLGIQKTTRNEGQTFQNKSRFGLTSSGCLFLVWVLCLLCLVLSALLGIRFNSSQVFLWIQSLFVSLVSCIFFIQPALILAAAVIVSVWNKTAPNSSSFSLKTLQVEIFNLWRSIDADQNKGPPYKEQISASGFLDQRSSHFKKLLAARQRVRYLRLLRPPTPSELRKSRGKRRRAALIHQTLRDLCFCAASLLLMTCVTYYSSCDEHAHLNRAVNRHFMRNNGFMSIQTHEDWWKWIQSTLLDLLDHDKSDKTEPPHVGIGDLLIQKTERSCTFQNEVFLLTHPRTCNHAHSEEVSAVGLGHKKSAAAELRRLQSSGWVGRQTVALKVQFTLYSPAANLFTSVTLLTEQSHSGVLRPSAKVQSVRVDPTPAGWDPVMVCQLLFLLLSLLQFCNHVSSAAQQGLMGNWRAASAWLDVSLLTVTLVHYGCCVYRSVPMGEVVNFLQEHSSEGRVDVNSLSTWEQCIRSLRGIILFILIVKTMTVLRVNRTLSFSAAVFTRSLSSLLSSPISCLVLLVVLSCLGNLQTFSSLQSLIWNYGGLRASRGLSGPGLSPWGVLILSVSVVWTVMVTGATSSALRAAKRPQSRKKELTTTEMFCYLKNRVSELTGRHRQTGTDCQHEEKVFLLEELEMSVDELLLRLSALSDISHLPSLPRSSCCREKDFPATCPKPQPSHTQDSLGSRPLNKSTQESDQRPAAFRPLAEQEVQEVLDQRRQRGYYHPEDTKERHENCLCCPTSTSDRETWTKDVLDSKSSCLFNKTHSKVVVEVLVHKEQNTEESDVLP